MSSNNEQTIWRRVESTLRQPASVPSGAVDRVMRRVYTTRMEPANHTRARGAALGWLTRRHVTVSPLQLLAASLVLAVAVGTWSRGRGGATARPAPSTTVLEASHRRTSSSQLVQFVFHATAANSVTVAGDFNDWDPSVTPLRESGDGVWSVVVPLMPGRHLYSFVVNGRQWVPDAEAPRAPETEFGAEPSVILVEAGT